VLLEGNKEDNQKQKESSLKAKEDIDKDKEELVSNITICYDCIKALLS
jgi:hypothetical protein